MFASFRKYWNVCKVAGKGNTDQQQANDKNYKRPGIQLFQSIKANDVSCRNFFAGALRRNMR